MRKINCFLLFSLLPIFIYSQTWEYINTQAEKLYEQGKYKEASQFFERILAQVQKESGKQDTNYAKTGISLADCYRQLNLFDKAETLYIEVKEIYSRISGKEHPDYATACNNLATLYRMKGQYGKAEQLYLEVKEIDIKRVGKEHPDYATSCDNLADLYKVMGLYSKAEKLFSESREIYMKTLGKTHIDYIISSNNLATFYYITGQYSKAEPLFTEVKEIRSKTLGKEHLDYALSCNNLALLYKEIGLYNKAESFLLEAKKIYLKLLGIENLEYATSCNNLALLYHTMGQYKKAELLFIEAKGIWTKLLGIEHPDYALVCNNLAGLYKDLGEYKKAETLYYESQKIRLKLFGKNHPAYANSCNNLAGLYNKQGLYSKAESLFTEVIEIRAKVLGKEHPDYANSCNNLAALYKKTNQYNKAEQYYMEAKEIREKTLGKTHLLYAQSCNNLGNLYWNTQNYREANKCFQEASQTLVKQTQTNFAYLSEKEKEQFLNTFKNSFEIYYSYVIQSNQSRELSTWLYNNLLIFKGLLFNTNQTIQKTILNSNNQDLIYLYNDFIALRKDIAKYSQLSIAQHKKKKINLDSLQNTANNIEKELSEKAYTIGIELLKKPYSLQDVKTKLNKDEALIEIIRIRKYDREKSDFTDSVQYGVFIITPSIETPLFFLLNYGNKLETQYITYYRRSVTNKIKDEESYIAFWKPIKKYLKGVNNVYFAPDGVYHQISMNTLYNVENKKYLNQELKIQLVTTGKDVITLKNKKDKKNKYERYQVYLFGYPNYKGKETKNENKQDSTRSFFFNEETRFFEKTGVVTMLPGTKEEVDIIGATAEKNGLKYTKYLFNEATEQTIKNIISPDILHIATHGFFKKNVEKQTSAEYSFFADNPLNRSGLLLADCEEYLQQEKLLTLDAEDGILTANECLNLDLHKTELVVLSACETGLGEVKNGEGVYGLQRALREAGAKCLVMSLWKVNDKTTRKFMQLFYENMFTKKQNKKEAFQNAQNSIRKEYPQPYYWGAFVMIGE